MLRQFMLTVFAIMSLSATSAYGVESYQTDTMYRALIKSVDVNDFDLMAAQYHRDAVLVSKKKTELISQSFKRWRADGKKIAQSGGKAELRMRFNNRVINDDSAYETGIYHYRKLDKNGKVTFEYYMSFADLNVKVNGNWQIIMERNVEKSTEAEFNTLPEWH
ncbi:hypothetical protein tinsulaeT_19430 [Thalassotalea insulae]|uniref:DUF4440 domain-containing protein n=1 Tax=Thalassotalea insulae TaxID=2056778 RepID=A0ABQ6GRN3_9GAMM|nr:hypothetical protein [Thalassotalea insulae]GLX78603.1 hypothetical protein tinsulaeT_19430 [Thalassotalea insulae]